MFGGSAQRPAGRAWSANPEGRVAEDRSFLCITRIERLDLPVELDMSV
jgi:hypothetical protein